MSVGQMERLADVFAAADVTDDTIARVKDEMRGASVEEQFAILIALRNAWATTGMATVHAMQTYVDLLSCDEAAPGLIEYYSEKIASEPPPKSRPKPQVDDEETTDLMRAARAGEVDQLHRLLLEGVPVDQMRPDGRTALMFAAQGGHLDAMIMLVEHGADIAHVRNPLTEILQANPSPNPSPNPTPNPNPNQVHAEGGTVLMQACRPGGLECARWLLDQGADVNQVNWP